MRQRGFTLLELMISILLFAMISSAAYKLFSSVSRAQEVTDGILDKLDAIQRAEIIIEKDFFQIIERPIRDEHGNKHEAVEAPAKSGFLVEFTRSGWRNPLDSLRSNLQRVAYNVEGDELIRYYWQMLDRAQEPVRFRQVVLSGVRSMNVRFLDEKRQWRNIWPPKKIRKMLDQSKDFPMPAAVEIAITHEEFGSIMTVVPLITYRSRQLVELDKRSAQEMQGGQQFNFEGDE
ncbi:type II secretion system protein GspJ [Endozoicomonas sp. (ex Bugula neritina AB1)]|nr:type II secretion system protein GspJ [Endozoicomonas sp. (ex Bugula neritina AB1)]